MKIQANSITRSFLQQKYIFFWEIFLFQFPVSFYLRKIHAQKSGFVPEKNLALFTHKIYISSWIKLSSNLQIPSKMPQIFIQCSWFHGFKFNWAQSASKFHLKYIKKRLRNTHISEIAQLLIFTLFKIQPVKN